MPFGIGPKHIQIAKSFLPSATIFGAGAATLGLYFASDWKAELLLKHVPFYSSKYEPKDADM